jgi:hypothetical protein
VVGGLSVNLHGVPRVTADVDLVIAMDRKNIQSLANVLKALDFLPRLPVNPEELSDPEKVKTWIDERNMKAFTFYHRKDNYKSVDIVLVHPLDFEKAFAKKTTKTAKEIEIYVASIDDIILMKEWSGRKQDLSDAALQFSYTLEDEKILDYLNLSTEDKLNWLEEIAEFNHLVLGGTKERVTSSPEAGEADRTD